MDTVEAGLCSCATASATRSSSLCCMPYHVVCGVIGYKNLIPRKWTQKRNKSMSIHEWIRAKSWKQLSDWKHSVCSTGLEPHWLVAFPSLLSGAMLPVHASQHSWRWSPDATTSWRPRRWHSSNFVVLIAANNSDACLDRLETWAEPEFQRRQMLARASEWLVDGKWVTVKPASCWWRRKHMSDGWRLQQFLTI